MSKTPRSGVLIFGTINIQDNVSISQENQAIKGVQASGHDARVRVMFGRYVEITPFVWTATRMIGHYSVRRVSLITTNVVVSVIVAVD